MSTYYVATAGTWIITVGHLLWKLSLYNIYIHIIEGNLSEEVTYSDDPGTRGGNQISPCHKQLIYIETLPVGISTLATIVFLWPISGL